MAEVLTQEVTTEERETIHASAEIIDPQAVASIHYATGKTDRPRGAVFDHAQRLRRDAASG